MADERPNGGIGGPPPPVAFAQPIITGILIGTAFLVIFLIALHHPAPGPGPLGVVGSPSVTQALNAGGEFDARTLADADVARRQVVSGEIDAAYVAGSQQLIVAGARGVMESRTLQAIFTPIATQGGGTLQVQDVVPVAKEDPNGVSVFYLIFGMTLGAFLFGQTVHVFGRFLTVRRKLVQTVIFSVVLGIIASAVAQGWVQALPGNPLAVIGVLVLLAAAVGAFTIAVTTVLGDMGVAVATIIALILGTAVSGGAVPGDFLPAGFDAIYPWLPPGAAVNAIRDIVYFDAGRALGPLLVLAVWLAASVLVFVGVPALRARGGAPIQARPAQPAAAPHASM